MQKLKKIIYFVKSFWFILGISLVIFMSCEGILRITYYLYNKINSQKISIIDPRIAADVYNDSTVSSSYFDEFNKSSVMRWQPYTYWRRKLYKGQNINVDETGKRLTIDYSDSLAKSSVPAKIFVFGGSAIWGTGVNDSSTIPSQLNKILFRSGVKSQVVNFGESGYVSTQELFSLMLEIKKGNIPDVVIFYDGVNDVFSAYQQGIAGIPMNEFNRVQEFNITDRSRSGNLYKRALKEFLNSFLNVKCLKYLLSKLDIIHHKLYVVDSYNVNKKNNLIYNLINSYKSNIRIVSNLSKNYGFKCLFYWQPTLFDKKFKTRYEEHVVAKQDTSLIKFYKNVYSIINDKGVIVHNFFDLSLIFENIKEPLYIDWVHLGDSGNQIIASRISQDVLALIKKL